MTRKFVRVATRSLSICIFYVLFSLSHSLSADTLYESASLGTTGLDYSSGSLPVIGHVISPLVYTGVVFELPSPAVTTRVGGHFVRRETFDSDFFGAIVKLTGPDDLPDSYDFSTPDVLGTSYLSFPTTSDEVFGDLSLSLEEGWYALVFASGYLGTSGQGALVVTGTDYGSPRYIARVYESNPNLSQWFYSSNTFDGQRFLVEGRFVPEPISAALVLTGTLFIAGSRRGLVGRRSLWGHGERLAL
jgi:hypothetical protein